MIKHIVLFKLKNDIEPGQKEVLKQDFKRALEALSGKIDCLRSIEVGLNDNPEESFDIALTTTFDTFDDLRHYATTPTTSRPQPSSKRPKRHAPASTIYSDPTFPPV